MKAPTSFYRRSIFAGLVLLLAGQVCTLSLFQTPSIPGGSTSTPVPVGPTSTPLPVAQTTFIVSLPEPLQPNETLAVATLDEMSGLSFNNTDYTINARQPLSYSPILYPPSWPLIVDPYLCLRGFPG